VPKYLFQVQYTLEGIRGLKDKGGTARVEASRALVEQLGGSLESFYFAFGSNDAYLIADLPDNVATAAVELIASSGGGVRTSTTVLLTPEEMDAAAKAQATYRPPGA
jgi:uncharacterized protein with GYD domain